MPPLSVLLLANWGIGAAVLETLLAMPGLRVPLVVGRHEPDSPDPWVNRVYDLAQAAGLRFVPSREASFEFLAQAIAREGVDLLLCHAYMRRLPPAVFAAPRLGGVNIHASLLPRHRGPAPSWWVLKNRESETGLTSHVLTEELDAGAVIHQVRVPVLPGDDMDALLDRLRAATPDLVRGTVARLLQKNFTPEPQCDAAATYAPRPLPME